MIRRSLDAVVVLMAAALALIAEVGGIDAAIGPLRVRVQDWTRPLGLMFAALAARAWIAHRSASPPAGPEAVPESRPRSAFAHLAALTMIALVIAACGVYLHYQVRVAGGLDSYGYISTASLIASGRLSEPQPLAAILPFDNPMNAAAPLGHVPGRDGTVSVPRYPIGLPLLMAPFLMFGAEGPYFVPFVTAVLALAMVYLLGRHLAGGPQAHLIGLLSAGLLACNPIFATYAIQPMSDVTATFWLIAAVWIGLRKPDSGSVTDGVAAGICAGMAVLTRPALAPAAFTLVAVTAGFRPRSMALAGTVFAFIAAQAALNFALYGSATASGYGTTSHMFELSTSRLGQNVWNFGKWLAYSHTPLFLLLWPGALFVLRAHRWAWQISAVAAAAAGPYLFYIIFDDWQSPRFILPAISLVLILSAIALDRVLPDGKLRPLVLAGIAVACTVLSHRFLEREGIGQLATLEAKYILVGEWFSKNTSERVVVLAGLHSGPIRFYGDRQTIRWDQIPEHALTATVASLIAEGYEPYLALDAPSEPLLFAERFGALPINAQPVARVRVVNIYKFMSAY